MAVELTASRLIAPYFGTSIFVWGNIIAVVMIALAIGYWLGGKLADKRPELPVLAGAVFFCGLFLSFLPLFFKPMAVFFLNALNVSSMFLFALANFWLILFALACPLIILGMSSPFVIRIVNSSVETTGKTAGNIFAWSTLGSIFGVFASTFVTVPFLGSMQTVLICAATLIILAGLYFPKKYKLLALVFILPLMVYFLFLVRPALAAPEKNIIFEKETPYQYVWVSEKDGWRFLQFNDGSGVQSYINFDRPHFLTGDSYYDFFNLLPYLNGQEDADKNFLMIGGGGGTAAKQLVSFWRPKVNIDLVEIDKEVLGAAEKYFDLNEPEINKIVRDGRVFLNQTDKKYDYMIIDAYSKQLFIPFHLTTDEFFQSTKTRLNEGGILAMNINAAGWSSELLQKISQTIRKNYAQVKVLPIEGTYNYLVFASDKEMNFDLSGADVDENLEKYKEKLYNVIELGGFDEEMILTDNLAPIEFMTDAMILKVFLNYLSGARNIL